jgi:predicted molibdopterin-dependent oxidoreductase YjgC
VGLLAGRIAQKGSGGVVPLPILGNAWGALGISRAFGATPTGEALAQLGEGKFKNVILLGIDPSAETPLKGLSEALAKTQTLIVATWLNPAAQTPGTHFLPLAAAVEAAGTVVSGSGEVMELPAVASPAGGAMAARELLSSLGANLGEGGTLSTMVRPEWLKPISASPQECLRDEAVLVEPGRDELVAVSESGCVHVGSGTVSARMSWPKAFEKNPTVRISPADAAQRGFGDSQTVTVSSANSSASMTVKVDMAMRPGRVALMATSPAVRRLFNWGKSGDGRIVSGPVAVRVSAS